MGSDASNEPTSAFTPPMVAKPLGDFVAVAGTLALSSNAHHEGHAGFIVIPSTSEDGSAKITNDLRG